MTFSTGGVCTSHGREVVAVSVGFHGVVSTIRLDHSTQAWYHSNKTHNYGENNIYDISVIEISGMRVICDSGYPDSRRWHAQEDVIKHNFLDASW